jgi:sensor histidine kinase YesM
MINCGNKIICPQVCAIFLIFVNLLICPHLEAQDKEKPDTLRIKNYIQLSYSYAKEGRYAEALKNGLIADSLAAENMYLPRMDFYQNLTRLMDRHDTSIFQFRLSKRLLHAVDGVESPSLKAKYLEYLGWIYFHFKKYHSGKIYFENCIKIIEGNNLQREHASAYEGLGTVYSYLDDFDNSMEYYRLYIQYADPEKEKTGLFFVNYYLGDKHRISEEYDQADTCYNYSFRIAREIKDTAKMISSLSRIAYNLYLDGQLANSLDHYLRNIELIDNFKSPHYLANQYGNIGNIYRDKKQYELAIENYKKSIEIAAQSRDLYHLNWVYNDLARLYSKLGEYDLAYNSLEKGSLYKDTLEILQYQNTLAREASRMEDVKRQKEVEMLNVKLRQNKTLNYSLASGLILILVIGFLILRQLKIRSSHNLDIMKRQVMELSQKNLLQQMNPHFIFNTLNSIQFYIFRNDKVASNNYLNKFAKLMRMILENSQIAKVSIDRELDALKLYLELETLRFKNKFDWAIEVDEDIDTLTFQIPTMLIQPYVENSITHGIRYKDGLGHISITMSQVDQHIKCIVEDDGIGRKAAEKMKEGRNNVHNSLGTKITESRMKLTKSLYGNEMRVTYTDLYDQHGNATGTRVEIFIPIINKTL